MSQTRTLTLILSDIRSKSQTENMTDAYPDAVLTVWVNKGLAEMYELQVAAKGADYFEANSVINTVSGTTTYVLPSNFYQLLAVEANVSGVPVVLRSFTRAERALLENPATSTDRNPLAYRIRGGAIELLPGPTTNSQVTLFYVPAPPVLANGSDTYDMVAGWEPYVVDYACREIAVREHDSQFEQSLAQSLAMMKQRIQEMAAHRDAAGPPRVNDVTLSRAPNLRRRIY